jgi:transcriptional regulator with XRE-family HTH domain
MNATIGKNLKALRKDKGVSQESIAEYLNISQSAYSRIEKGTSHSWAIHLEKICKFYKIDNPGIFFEKTTIPAPKPIIPETI